MLICLHSLPPSPAPTQTGWQGEKKIATLVALELLIWHSLVLFRNQTQKYKQKLINWNYYGYSSITYVWPHFRNPIWDWVFLRFTGLKKVLGIILATKTLQMLNKKVIMKQKIVIKKSWKKLTTHVKFIPPFSFLLTVIFGGFLLSLKQKITSTYL